MDTSPFDHLYPFERHYADVDGFRCHYLDEGRGDAVVMVHGNPTWSFYYRHLVTALFPTHRCIVPDHIGCGLSEKPDDRRYPYTLDRRVSDLSQLLEQIGVTSNISLVVHDWGGMIGLAWALDHLDRIRRIVILNTAGFFPPGGKGLPLRLAMIRRLPALAAVAVRGLNLFCHGAVWMAARKRLPYAVRAGLTAPYNNWRNRVAVHRFVQDIPIRPSDPSHATVARVDRRLHRIADVPLLICWGKHDFVFDVDYFEEWRRRFPDAVAHLFDDAGHYILEDEPDAVATKIKTFLKES